jgi:3-octaprenyl-4-hydroxybenzoate carboxy-lyase
VVGMHPAMFMLAGLEIPYGKNEIEAAGGILGEPVEVFNMPLTGLPVPANAEIAFEGFIHPGDELLEGPLGEMDRLLPVGQQFRTCYPNLYDDAPERADPDGRHSCGAPNDNTFYLGTYRCGAVWNQLEAAGIPGVQGVWAHEAGAADSC